MYVATSRDEPSRSSTKAGSDGGREGMREVGDFSKWLMAVLKVLSKVWKSVKEKRKVTPKLNEHQR